ncbi:MAG: hypothetical protein WC926_03515 [Candidatus Paceibacterota bacterium]
MFVQITIFNTFFQFNIFQNFAKPTGFDLYIYIQNTFPLPPPAAKMRWPAPIRARLPPCERRPGKPQFGRASEAQSGVGNCHLGLAFGILNSFRVFLKIDTDFFQQTPHITTKCRKIARPAFGGRLFCPALPLILKVNPRRFQFHGECLVMDFKTCP